MAEKKEALSLNQRHNRLLHDLSSPSHSKNPNRNPESKHTIPGRRRLCKATSEDSGDNSDGDGAPNFSGIVDFDSPSPSPVAELQAKVKKEEVVVSSIEQLEGEKNMASRNECIGSTADDLASKPGVDKTVKVKIEGRRRLCKVRVEDEHDHVDDHPSFSAVTDFDSPTPVKNIPNETNAGGGDEIRDILNNLSSRLSILSIKKIGRPNKFSSSSVLNEGNNRLKIEALSEDADDPLFPITFKHSDSSLEVDHQQRVENVEPFEESVSSAEHVDESDDCVVTSGHKFVKKGESQHGKFRQDSDDSDLVQIMDDSSDEAAPRENISITLTGPGLTYKLPDKIAHMLYPHQREGLKWLWSLHCRGKGGILGDDMGLGKTMQICGFLVGLFHSHLIKRVLIVAPKTLLPHWIKELAAVGLSEKTREYFGTCVKARQYELQYILQDGGVLLTTYDIVRNNAKSLSGDSYFHNERDEDDVTWDYMVLDEGHLIKNPSTQRAKSLLEIPCAHRIIISGTPLQNNLKELWALFNFCCPELLGDKNCFKTKYESAILRGNEKNASDRDKRVGSAVAQDLRACIQPYFLRRLKSEVFHEDDAATTAKLSKKNEIIIWLKLTSVQRRLYEAYLKSELVLSAFDGSPLAALTILKKICDHPLLLTKRAAEDVLEGMESVLTKEDHGVAEKLAMHLADVAERFDFVENHDNVSCKISFVLSLLDNLIPDGHNVLIFSQTRKMLNLIQDSLLSRGYSFLRIDGTTKAADRLKIVNDFQEGIGAPIFLLTSQVGGLGLTLTKADRVIVVDPAWNPSTDNQSVDRAYRIGQTNNVIVYRLMTCGTVEEKIYRKQIYKGGLFKSATEHKEQIRYFSQQDLRELFSLPRQGFDVSPTQQQLHEEHDSEHTMDASLKVHTEFLETLGIAGISHHSLLFSKTAPVPVVQEDELPRTKPSTYLGNPSSHSSRERDVDGAQYAFNPKDVNLQKKTNPQNIAKRLAESEIKEKIKRLSQVVSNKVMVSNLPDKGEKLQKHIGELNLELDKIRTGRTEKETINLDDISGEFNSVECLGNR